MDKQTLMRTIGNNIRNHRKLRGLTQEQLAERAGISTSFCANIERGNKGISLFVLKDISDILEVSVDCLMSAEDDYYYMQDIAALLNGRPKEFIIAVEQIVRICVKEFAESGSGQGGTEWRWIKMLDHEQRDAIEALYRSMFDSLYYYALNALEDRSLAEEAVQDTFRIACAKPGELLSSKNPPGWLANTLKHVISNIRRSRSRMAALFVDVISANIDAACAGEYKEHSLLMYSDLLPPEEYELLRMAAIDGCSMLEIAKHFGISVDACRKRIQRLKKKMRKIIENL